MIKSLTILCVLLAASTAQAHWNYRYDFTSTYTPYYAPVYQSYYYPAYRPYYAPIYQPYYNPSPCLLGW